MLKFLVECNKIIKRGIVAMNKKLEEVFKELGLQSDGKIAYGFVEGFEVSVSLKSVLYCHISFYAEAEVKRTIANQIRDLKLPYVKYMCTDMGIDITKTDMTMTRLAKNFSIMLEKILNVLKMNECLGMEYCPVCGDKLEEEMKSLRTINGLVKVTLDQKCVENINASIEEQNKQFEEQPNNYLRGTLGAVLGAAIGVLVYVVLFFLNFISSISCFIAVLLGGLFYKLFGGKQNKIMIVIVTVVSLVAMLLTVFVLYMKAAEVLDPDYGFYSTGMQAFSDMMTVSEFSGEFIANMLMTAMFSLLGAGAQIAVMVRNIKREQQI